MYMDINIVRNLYAMNRKLTILLILVLLPFSMIEAAVQEDSLKNKYQEMRARCDSLRKENLSLNRELRKLQLQKSKDSTFLAGLKLYDNNMLQDCLNYLKQPYTQMQPQQLNDMQSEIDAFKENVSSRELSNYSKRLQATIKCKQLYEHCVEINRSPFNPAKITEYADELYRIIKLTTDNPSKGDYKVSKEQYDEAFSIIRSLSWVGIGINCMQKLISGRGNQQKAKTDLQKALERSTEDSYLRNLNERWEKEKANTAHRETPVKDEIMGYRTEDRR